jgi:hypothetical protein
MGHHHHHHDPHMPELPKVAGQILFVVVVALLAGVSFFIYKKLIPVGEMVSQQEEKNDLVQLCREDMEGVPTGQFTYKDWEENLCPCVAKAIVEHPPSEFETWLKQSDRAARLSQYELYKGLCEGELEN